MDVPAVKTDELPIRFPETTISGQADDHDIIKLTNIFSDMCNRLLDNITQRRIIQERSLLDFSKLVLWVVNGTVKRLPESFNELAAHISDYWHYEIRREDDSERKYSYIRFYQMICIIKTYHVERELEDKAFSAMEKNQSNTELLRMIQQCPGITHKQLWDMFGISSVELQKQLKPLDQEGFLSSRRSGEDRYYMLTNAGEILYQKLNTLGKNRTWSDLWSEERTFVLFIVLDIQQKRGRTRSQVLEVVQLVAKCSNDLIAQVAKKIARYIYSSQQEDTENNGRYVAHNSGAVFYKGLTAYPSGSQHPPFLLSGAIKNLTTKIGKKETYFSQGEKEYVITKHQVDDIQINISKSDNIAM